MRVFGLGLVALAALSAVGLMLDDQLSHEVAVAATAENVRAANIVTASMASGTAHSEAPATAPGADATSTADRPRASQESGAEPPLFVPPIVTPNPALAANDPPQSAVTPVSTPAATSSAAAVTPPTAPPSKPDLAAHGSAAPVERQTSAETATVAGSVVPSSATAGENVPAPSVPALPANSPPSIAVPTSSPPALPADARVAKVAFGAVTSAAPMAARAIGFYSRGCLAGAHMLPVDGPAWQAMRLSRNRNWGHPNLIRYVEKLAMDSRAQDGWSGLLVGDLSQPRGGPMLTGHASHQIGLDADIWFTPMPDRRLTAKEREDIAATDMLGPYKVTVDPAVWKPEHVSLIKRATSYPEVERILVHPAIKKALCDAAGPAGGPGRDWFKKVRPYWGHHYHFHVRVACPADSATCAGQAPPPNDDGCGKELEDWFKVLSAPPKPEPVHPIPEPPSRQITLDQLPAECRQVLDSGESSVAVHAASALAPVAPPRRIRSPAAAKAAAKAVARAKALATRPAAQRSAGR